MFSITHFENTKEIVATVNDDIMLLEELERAAEEYRSFNIDELIEELILEYLVLQKAEDYNIKITDEKLKINLEQVQQFDGVVYEAIIKK